MLKLYRLSAQPKQYWETWEASHGTHIVHWGELGTEGKTETVRSTMFRKAGTVIQKRINELVSEGYAPVDPEDRTALMIEYAIEGMGTPDDLDKRYRLEDRMNETLGWKGLGVCDGGSIGSGTMEICNFVVDFETAKRVIEQDLLGTEFSNYSRIYDEGAS